MMCAGAFVIEGTNHTMHNSIPLCKNVMSCVVLIDVCGSIRLTTRSISKTNDFTIKRKLYTNQVYQLYGSSLLVLCY